MPREYGTLFFLQDLNGGFFHSFNIKGWGHFVVYFRLNFLHFLRFGWYRFEQTVVPLWCRS
jgi:hypothetical protein